MHAALRVAAAVLLLALALPVRAGPGILYVALGGSGRDAGAARPGDPARVAARLEGERGDVRVLDLTSPGATIHDVLTSQLPRALALRPAIVTLALDPAEVWRTSLRSFSRDLQEVTDLLSRARTAVVVSSLAPASLLRPGAGRGQHRRVDAFDFAIRRAARRNGLALGELRARRTRRPVSWEAAVGDAAERLVAPRGGPSRPAGGAAARGRRAGEAVPSCA